MKRAKTIGIGIFVVFVGGFIYFILNFGPIISGFGAKAMCSCVYNGERTIESVIQNELGAFPLNLGSFKVNQDDSSVVGTVFGFARSEAIFRKGLGCTLVRGTTKDALRRALPRIKMAQPILSDSLFWPQGNRLPDTIPMGIDVAKLDKVVDQSFEDSNPEIPIKTRAVLVIYKGQLIAEQYDPEFSKESLQIGWSMTKSVTNILYGILVQKGILRKAKEKSANRWKENVQIFC